MPSGKTLMMREPCRHHLESVTMKSILPALLISLACATAPAAHAAQDASTASTASSLIAEGSATVVAGSLSVLAGSSSIVVESVQVAGGVTTVVLKGASKAAGATLQLSSNVAMGASLVAGASVFVVVVATGYLVVSASQVIAFVPNKAGSALLHHSRSGA
jgi:hypothetical protein